LFTEEKSTLPRQTKTCSYASCWIISDLKWFKLRLHLHRRSLEQKNSKRSSTSIGSFCIETIGKISPIFSHAVQGAKASTTMALLQTHFACVNEPYEWSLAWSDVFRSKGTLPTDICLAYVRYKKRRTYGLLAKWLNFGCYDQILLQPKSVGQISVGKMPVGQMSVWPNASLDKCPLVKVLVSKYLLVNIC
jgi:hypothetical protein